MAHPAAEIASAIVTELNGAEEETFSVDFTAVRHYVPEHTLQELASAVVSVVPAGVTEEIHTRATTAGDYTIDIGVQQAVDPATLAEVDALLSFILEITDFFRLRALTEYPAARWIKTESVPLYSPDHLREERTFTSVIRLTYNVAR